MDADGKMAGKYVVVGGKIDGSAAVLIMECSCLMGNDTHRWEKKIMGRNREKKIYRTDIGKKENVQDKTVKRGLKK